MNILLTGGAGYIGSHTAVVLSQCGYEVVLLDNFCNSRKSILERLQKILGKALPCIEGDLRDTKLLAKTLNQFSVDAVIHFAGLKAVGESVNAPLNYYENNVQGTLSLLRAMSDQNIKNIVFSSSATVYGEPQYLPIDEFHPLAPTNPYGRTKLQIEQILKDVTRADSSWRVINLRYFNPAGAHHSGLLGEDPQEIPNNLMPYIAQVATGQLRQLSVFGDDYPTKDGTGVRDFIHVVDLAEGHLAALSYLSRSNGFEIFNLGTGIGYSVLEIISAFENASAKTISYRVVNRRPGDIGSCYALADKANKVLGWKASRSLVDMCASGWQFQSQLHNTNPSKN